MENNYRGQSRGDRPPQLASKRGRPTPSQAAAIDRNILSVARSLFLSRGYAITSMEAVAAAAGVSKGTLYARYASKSDLFTAIVAERVQAWAELSAGVISDPAASLEQRLLQRANVILDSIGLPEVRAFDRLVQAEAQRFPELARDFYDHGYTLVVEMVKSDIMTTSCAEAPANVDPLSLARIFTAALLGWSRIESSVRDVEEAERRAFAADMVALFLSGLSRSPLQTR